MLTLILLPPALSPSLPPSSQVIDFMTPRVIVLQRLWRELRYQRMQQKHAALEGASEQEAAEDGKAGGKAKGGGGGDGEPSGDASKRATIVLKLFSQMSRVQADQKQRAHTTMKARLAIINMRTEIAKRKIEAAKRAALKWQGKVLLHVCCVCICCVCVC